jgi:hypothetical protein
MEEAAVIGARAQRRKLFANDSQRPGAYRET